ncbi:unnamed protein product [Gulo gulo]|uniref:Uncharacterized protein n=1 Tax=Gulo gulo TaxID=48420 RepID=A0A9X9LP15_GULGU|nr:unnamed protein product [Gulo gulo]
MSRQAEMQVQKSLWPGRTGLVVPSAQQGLSTEPSDAGKPTSDQK